MEKFYKKLNHLLNTLQINRDKALQLQSKYEELNDSQKQYLEDNIGEYDSSKSFDEYFQKSGIKDGEVDDYSEVGNPFEIEVVRQLKTLNSSVDVVKGILVFFSILWIIGVLISLFMLFS